MEEILKELNEAHLLLGTISLCGDAVDTMAAAKAKLRKACSEIKKMEKKETEGAEDK